MLVVWWPTYLTKIVVPAIPHALMVNTISMLVLMILIPVAGWLSDIVGRRTVLATGLVGVIIVAYPLFKWTDHGVFSAALTSQLIFTVMMSAVLGPMATILVELFPTRIRLSAIGVGYNVMQAVFGGTAPLVCTFLIARTGDIISPVYYLIAMGIVSLVATSTIGMRSSEKLE